MAPKKTNSKAEAGRARKAEQAASKNKDKQAQVEKEEAAKWSKGAKSNKKQQDAEDKRAEQERKRAEKAALVAAEEAENAKISKKNAPNKSAAKKKTPPQQRVPEIPEFSASGLDDALELLTLATEGSGVGVGNAKDKIERHPERRVAAAYAIYSEREMPILKAENPGLRHTQYTQLLLKQWKKSPENPMNQQHIAYNESVDSEREIVNKTRSDALDRHRVN